MSASDKHLTAIDLSPDQRAAYEEIVSWVTANNSPLLTLGGLAGSGKSSLLGVLGTANLVSPVAYVTYTGKAASVLKRKLAASGIDTIAQTVDRDGDGPAEPVSTPYCGTIHSLIYAPVEDEQCPCGHSHEAHTKYDEANPFLPPACGQCACAGYKKQSTGRVRGWRVREELDRPYKLIVIDEASMVSDDMLEDLQRFSVPVLAVGDHGQLPPVGGLGTLVQNPDIRLEKIHRQAEGSPIIRMSKQVREFGRLVPRMADGDVVKFGRIASLQNLIESRYRGADARRLFDLMIITGTNRRRVAVNQMVRRALGHSGPPAVGEQVICLRNMRDRGVYNGMRGIVERVDSMAVEGKPWQMQAQLRFPEDNVSGVFTMFKNQFNREKTFSGFDELEEVGVRVDKWDEIGGLFDFGYALTCHRCQGSSYDDVLVVAADWMGTNADAIKRWAYTAVTRAVSKLTVLLP